MDNLQKPLAFADAITADHMILSKGDKSRHNDRVACVVQDQHTKYLMSFAAPTKSAIDTKKAFQRFLGPQVKPKHVYTDGSEEFERALKDFDILCDTSTPYRAETNGIAERAVRRVKEGTSCALVQSALSGEWWREASNTYCFLRNVTEVLACGSTAYEKRFNEKFTGPIIPFGAEIAYLPSARRDEDRLHKFGKKTLSDFCCRLCAASGGLLER